MQKLALELGRRALGEDDASISPMMSPGRVNETFRVDGTSDRVVVRLNADTHRVGEFLKEQWAMKQAHSAGVRTPAVLAVGSMNGTSYQVQSHIEGRHPEAGDEDAWHSIGVELRTVHGVRTRGWGGKLDLERGSFVHSWDEHVLYGLSQLGESDTLRSHGLLDGELSTDLMAAWQRDLSDLSHGLSHGDVSVRNIILNLDGGVTFIDWGCCSSGPVPYRDIIDVVGEHDPSSPEFCAFLHGYGTSWPDLEPQIRSIATLGAIDLCRWALDRRPDELKRCLSQAEWALDVFWRGHPWRPKPAVLPSD